MATPKAAKGKPDKLLTAVRGMAVKRSLSGRVMMASEKVAEGRVSTGCLALDLIMGGGLYYGRPAEFFGDYSTGKSLVLAHLAREAQRAGAKVILVDSEKSYDPRFGTTLGIDNTQLVYLETMILEDVSALIMFTVERARTDEPGRPVVLLIDSLARLIPRPRMENELEKADLHRAQILKKATERWATLFDLGQVAIAWANQQWEKIPTGWQPPGRQQEQKTATSGGRAPRYWANVRIGLSRGPVLKDGTKPKPGEPDLRVPTGEYIKAVCERSKIGIAHGHCSLLYRFGHGLDRTHGLWEGLIRTGRLTGAEGGGWQLAAPNGEVVEFEQADFPALVDERPDLLF